MRHSDSSVLLVGMSFLCRRVQPFLWHRSSIPARLLASQPVPDTSHKRELPECDTFGSIAAKEVLSSEYLPDDDDNYDKLESMKRRRPIEHYNFLLNRLLKAGGPEKMKKAMQVFEQMQREGRYRPEKYHMTMMISGCAEFGLVDKAFHFFDLLLKKNKKPTKATVTSLLNACAESRDREKGLQKLAVITDWIRETSYPCNVIQYNAMIKAYAKQGDLKSAFAVTKDMAKEGHELTAQSYSMLLMGCITDRESGFSHAIRILREMRKHMPIVEHTVNLFLRVVRDCGVGSEDHLRRLFPPHAVRNVTFLPCTDLQVQGHKDTSPVPSSPVDFLMDKFPNQEIILDMSALKKGSNRLALVGGWDGILRLLHDSGAAPSLATIGALIQCLPPSTDMEDQLIRRAESSGLILDTDFFNIVIRKRAMRGDSRSARNVLVDMQMRHVSVDIVTFGTLAMTCNNRQVGQQLMADMRTSGFKMNKEIAGALIYQSCKHFDFDYVTDVLKAMERDAVRPDPKMLEQIEAAKITAERVLVKMERDQEVDRVNNYLLTNEMFDRFKMFHKSWLKRNGVDFVEPEERQFDFEISPEPRQKMFEFEQDMRRRISEVRGERFRTARREVRDFDQERELLKRI